MAVFSRSDGAPSLHFVYILLCRDRTFYTGSTRDLSQRLYAHLTGHGARYTRARPPVALVYWEACDTRRDALRREFAIKGMTRSEKEKLVHAFSSGTLPLPDARRKSG